MPIDFDFSTAKVLEEEEDIIPLETPVAPVEEFDFSSAKPLAEKEPGDFFATREEEVASEGKGPNYPTEAEPEEFDFSTAKEAPPPDFDFSSAEVSAHPVGIVTAYRPGGGASMGLNAGIEGADLDAHDTPILGRTTFEDYIDGRGDYVTVAMDKNSSWQNQFLSSPNFPGMVFQVRDNGGYGNGKTGENWIDIAFTDPQKAKSMLLRGVPFTPITPEQAQTMSASRENITHTPRLQALYVPGGSFSQKEETGLPDPFMEFTARTARGVETGTREMFGGAQSLIESAFRGERNVYADEPEKAEGDIPVLEEQIATLQKELRDRVLKDDPASADWALSTTFDSPELGKLDKQLKDARRAAAGDVTESVMGQISRQTERLAIEAEQNQVAAMRKWEPYISASRDTQWGMQLGDALGRTVPGVLTSIYNPILGAAAIYAQIYQSSLQQYMAEKPDATREEAQKFANDQALVQAPWALAGNQLTARALKASFAALPAGAVERGARIFGTQLGQAISKNAQAFVGNVGSAVGQSVTSDMVSEDYDLLEETTLGEKVARAKEPASLAAGVSAVFGAAGVGVAAAKRPTAAKPKAEPAPKEVPTKEITLKALPAPEVAEKAIVVGTPEDPYLYHASHPGNKPSIVKEGTKPGSWFAKTPQEAAPFAGDVRADKAFFRVKKSEIKDTPAGPEDIFGQEFQKGGIFRKSSETHKAEEVDQFGNLVAPKAEAPAAKEKAALPAPKEAPPAFPGPKIIPVKRTLGTNESLLDLPNKELVRLMPNTGEHFYHATRAESLPLVQSEGLKPGKERKGEITGVYLAEDGLDVLGLLPKGSRKGDIILRVRRDSVNPVKTEMYPEGFEVAEWVSKERVPPGVIEVLGADEMWYPVREPAALAVRPPKYSPEEAALSKEEAAKAPPPALPPSKSIVGPVPPPPGQPFSIKALFQNPVLRRHIQSSPGNIKSFLKLRSPIKDFQRFWIGTAEVFENAPGLEPLGKAIRNYIDDRARINARDTNPFRLWEKSVTAKQKAEAQGDFYRFFMQADDPDVNVQKLAVPTYWAASPKGRELIDLTRDYFNRSGIENQAENVQVFDPKIQGWRPIQRVMGAGDPIPTAWYPGWKPGYFPRMVGRDIMDIIKDPKGHPAAYQGVLDEMTARGFNPNDAQDYLSRIARDSTSNDYFGSLDLARTADLPTKMNDYTFETVRRYISARSNRLAQIRNFGQKTAATGPASKDLFEKYHEHSDDLTQKYINYVRSQIFNTQLVGPFRDSIRGLGTALTGMHLGNPFTAARNLFSGQAMIGTQYGIRHHAEGVHKAFENINDAYEKGIIIDDLFNLIGDGENLGGRSMIQSGTDFLLKWSGEIPAENFNRVVNMGAAKALLRDAIAEYQNKGPTKKLLRYMGHFKRLGGIDPQALLDEGGSGPLTDRYLRQSVKHVQGGYQIDQVPAFQETDAARFFLKYSKWGTQQTNFFAKEVVRPAIRSLTFGKAKQETVEVRDPVTGRMETKQVPGDLKKAAAYFTLLAGAGGMAAQFGQHALGIEDTSESLAEIISKSDKDGQAAFFAVLNKLFQYQLVMGIGGSVGNLSQFGYDWTQRRRFKDPLAPPGLEFIKSSAQLALDGVNQGGFTLRDWDTYLRKNLSSYRTLKQFAAYLGNDVYPLGFRALQVESLRQDMTWMRSATKRFEDEMKIGAPPGGPPSMGKNPMSPFNMDLNEALMIGDVADAKRLVTERVRSAGRNAETVMESIMDSVRARRPIKAGGSTSEAIAQNFMRWADENMSAADAAKIRRIDKTYTNTAIAAGILKPGKERTSEEIAESLRNLQIRTEMRQSR